MKSIWKFPLRVEDEQEVMMPYGAEILCVQVQNGVPCLWAEVESTNTAQARIIRTRGTGHPFVGKHGEYVGTYQLDDGAFLGHVYDGDWA
jgi:hypothetical protein